jgi:hypothetical protein
VKVVPGTAAYGIQLQYLLAQPELAPLVADPRFRRLVNPLCRMLGIPKLPPVPPVPPVPPLPKRQVTPDPRNALLANGLGREAEQDATDGATLRGADAPTAPNPLSSQQEASNTAPAPPPQAAVAA